MWTHEWSVTINYIHVLTLCSLKFEPISLVRHKHFTLNTKLFERRGMNGDVRLCFTPQGFPIFTQVHFSPPPCNEEQDLVWTFDNYEGEEGVLSVLLELDS